MLLLLIAQISVYQLLTGVVLALLIALFSYRAKFLTRTGSIATFFLATIIYSIGGWVWTVPILTFFISSSLLSKIGKARKQKLELMFDKTDVRDEGQVAANGGVAGVIILVWLFFPEYAHLYLFYTASLASVAADTWATEIGTLAKGNPVSILTFKKVEPGTSGGVSFIGVMGGIAGALLVICSAWLMQSELFSLPIVLKLLIASTIASLADSIMGTTLQAEYKTEDGILTEKTFYEGKKTTLVQGVRWINNDVVNLCCALSGVAVMYFLL